MLSQFLSKYGPNKAICNKYTDFFQNYRTATYLNIIEYYSSSWHISIEISKKNPRWVERKGKIWPNSSTKIWTTKPENFFFLYKRSYCIAIYYWV